jgi:hypothetical protein
MANGGLIHDRPAVERYHLFGSGQALAQGEEGEDSGAVQGTPSESYKQKSDSLKVVLETV